MKNYTVIITETLQMQVHIEAGSASEAKDMVEKNWKAGNYVLDADHFKQVNFTARTAEKSRSYGRC